MNTLRILLLLVTVSCYANQVDRQDIKLNTNEVLKAAKIVAIGKETVTIVHAAGSVAVPFDDVPLDVLARAHMRLSEDAAEREKRNAEVAKKADAESARIRAEREEEMRVRLAFAGAHARQTEQARTAAPTKQRKNIEADLVKLKASVPRHSMSSAMDPAIRDCVAKYSRAFEHISPATIAQSATWLRENLTRDLAVYQQTLATTVAPKYKDQKTATSSMRTAATANIAWLNALLGHTTKIEALAR